MAGFNGRQLVIDYDSTTLAGVRTRGLSVSNDYVDVTNDDDSGWRTLLANPGVRSLEVTVSGITSDEVMLAAIMAANISAEAVSAELPTSLATPGTVAGNYLVSSLEISGEHDGATEYSVTFMSTGAITYTASTA